MFKLIMTFPSNEELISIVNMTQYTLDETANAVIDGKTLLQMRETTKQIPVINEILEYTARLVSATHAEIEGNTIAKKYLRYGASPRAAQALITGAKVRALMHGKYNVSYEDIDALAYPVLRHRIKINYDAISDHLDADAIISLIIKETKKHNK